MLTAAQFNAIRADVAKCTGALERHIELTSYPATGAIEATVTKGGLTRTFTVAPARDYLEAV